MSFDAWKDGRVSPATVEVPVAVLDVKDSPQIRATLRGHTGPVSTVVFTPDGKTLATATYKGEVKLWDAETGEERRSLSLSGSISRVVFFPDGRTIATPWYEPFGKDGKTLSGSYRRTDVKGYRGGIRLCDAATGKERGVLQRSSPRGFFGISLSRDGKMLAAEEIWREEDDYKDAKKDAKTGIALWDVATGKVIRDLDSNAGSLAFAPDGKTLAVSTGYGEGVKLLDVATGKERGKCAAEKTYISELAFTPDGKTLAGCNHQGTVYLWDAARGEEKAHLQHGETQMASCLAFAPDGKTLAVGVGPRNSRVIEGGEIVLWDPATREKRLTLRGHIGNVRALTFNADSTLLASGGVDNTVKLWDIAPRSASKR
ncbi:MAG: WD40 repeat domain-containing protein [Gemmataceae bacterium]